MCDKKSVLFVLFMTIMPCLPAVAQLDQPSDSVEQEIRKVEEAERQAMLAGDLEKLDRLWSDVFTVTNPANRIVNKQNVLDRVRNGQLRYSSFERRPEYIGILGEVVVVMGLETVVPTGDRPDAGRSLQRRYTNVWRKENGMWRSVARHANIIPAQ